MNNRKFLEAVAELKKSVREPGQLLLVHAVIEAATELANDSERTDERVVGKLVRALCVCGDLLVELLKKDGSTGAPELDAAYKALTAYYEGKRR